jgi:hypothetical protein
MYHPTLIVTAIVTDRIREAEQARRVSRINVNETEAPQRARRLRSLATRIAAPGLR